MSAFLALHFPSPGLDRGRILAVTRNPRALRCFRQSMLRDSQSLVDQAASDVERELAKRRLEELRAIFDLVLSEDGGVPDAATG